MAYLATEPDLSLPLTHRVPGINHVAYLPEGSGRVISDVRMNIRHLDDQGERWSRNLGSKLDKVRPTERIRGLCLSPSGHRVYVAAADTVYALDAATGDIVWKYEPPRSWGFLVISPIALACAPNGEVTASFDNGSFTVWDEDGQVKGLWQDNDAPRHLFYAADGQRLVGSDSFSLCLWDPAMRKRVVRLPLQDRAFAMASSSVAAVATIRTLHHLVLWDLHERREMARVPVEPGLPLIAFHPNGELLATTGRSGVVVLDLSLHEVARFDVPDATVLAITFSPDGREVSLGLSNDEVRTFAR